MSTDTPEPSEAPQAIENISLSLSEDGEVWVAKDEDTGVASQGETREQALENLDEAVAGFHGAAESVDSWEEKKAVLEDLGLDADEVQAAREEAPDTPEFMQE